VSAGTWQTVCVTAWRVMCEGDATSAFERGPFNHDEFSEATDALVAAREEHPTHEFYLVAEIDA
jgi:hypothetical protein